MGKMPPQRETWKQWLPPDVGMPEVISRAELLLELAERGIEFSERTLRYWELQGVLPRAERRAYEGLARAVYPAWMAEVIAGVAPHRALLPLPRIGALARLIFIDYAHQREEERARPVPYSEGPELPMELVRVLGVYLATHGGEQMEITVRFRDGGCLTRRIVPLPCTTE